MDHERSPSLDHSQLTDRLVVLPTPDEVIRALSAQVAFLVQQMQSALGHLDNKSHCGAVRDIEFALNSVGKMPAGRGKKRKA